jgi:hypothetical protein
MSSSSSKKVSSVEKALVAQAQPVADKKKSERVDPDYIDENTFRSCDVNNLTEHYPFTDASRGTLNHNYGILTHFPF